MRLLLSILVFFFVADTSLAQQSKPPTILVLAPVYIDSAFDNQTYKLGNANLPKYMLPGLDFYNGIMLATDTLNKEHEQAILQVIDTKSTTPLLKQLEKVNTKELAFIIAFFNNRTELKQASDFALLHNIPLISATYPNDGGINANPFFVMINPTLHTHIEGLYKYVQKNYALNNIIWVTKKGSTEEMIAQHFNALNKSTPAVPIKFKSVILTDSFTVADLRKQMDSSKTNIVISGTVNEVFGLRMVKTLAALKNYKSTTIGMPTWDGIKELNKEDCKGVEIIYTTPYYFSRTEKTGIWINNSYKTKLSGRPSDMVFKGYEMMYRLTKLYNQQQNNFINNLNSKTFIVFNEFDIQPEKNNKQNPLPDYLENKKLYFIRKLDGVNKVVN